MKKLVLIALTFGLMFTSCQKSNPHKGYKSTSNGLYYQFYEENEGENPKLMDLMDVVLSCKINDTAIIMPENRITVQLLEPMFAGDLFEGLKMMHIGDTASFIVRTDSTFMTLFQSPVPPQFSASDIMKFNIRVNDFYPESEYLTKQIEIMKKTYVEETAIAENELKEYFEKNNIIAEPTATGLYYVKTKDGNGEKPTVKTMVKVHYTGRLLDGTVFDSSVDKSEPFQFMLGVGQVIPGWDEGIQLMSKGEKGTLYIPYYLAYGNHGSGIIPPFSNLIFDIELIDF